MTIRKVLYQPCYPYLPRFCRPGYRDSPKVQDDQASHEIPDLQGVFPTIWLIPEYSVTLMSSCTIITHCLPTFKTHRQVPSPKSLTWLITTGRTSPRVWLDSSRRLWTDMPNMIGFALQIIPLWEEIYQGPVGGDGYTCIPWLQHPGGFLKMTHVLDGSELLRNSAGLMMGPTSTCPSRSFCSVSVIRCCLSRFRPPRTVASS